MDKELLQELVKKRYTNKKIAEEMQCSQTNVRYWIKKYSLKTFRGPHGKYLGIEIKSLADKSKREIMQAAKKADSKAMLARLLGYSFYNGKLGKDLDSLISRHDIDTSHFDKGAKRLSRSRTKHKKITKSCPVCSKQFTTKEGGSYATETCSRSCANTYFRSGVNHPNWKDSVYRTTCFYFHKKECVVCGENIMVEVHHLDENHKNNLPNNLIPLCPTHHRYWHSNHKYMIENVVLDYAESFLPEIDS